MRQVLARFEGIFLIIKLGKLIWHIQRLIFYHAVRNPLWSKEDRKKFPSNLSLSPSITTTP